MLDTPLRLSNTLIWCYIATNSAGNLANFRQVLCNPTLWKNKGLEYRSNNIMLVLWKTKSINVMLRRYA